MFERTLELKLKKVFGMKRVSYDQPGDSREQEVMFVEIETARNWFKDKRVLARVQGKATVFANNEKMPFGYFSKQIEAHPSDTGDMFFYGFEENTKLYENIMARSFSFIYFFDSQYDPDTGTITSITTEVTVT